jgi:hypothetical protein
MANLVFPFMLIGQIEVVPEIRAVSYA